MFRLFYFVIGEFFCSGSRARLSSRPSICYVSDSDKSKDSDSKRDDRISKDSKRDDRASARREPKYELKRGSKQDTRQEEDDGIQFLGTIQKGSFLCSWFTLFVVC